MKNEYYISIQSGKTAIICGCESVIEYSDQKIALRLTGGRITFCGQSLTMSSYFGNEIKICGNINSFYMEPKQEC